MVRRVPTLLGAVVAAVALLASMLTVALPVATAQEVPRPEIATPGEAATYADDRLQSALAQVDLVDEWVDASEISASASLVEVLGDEAYERGRRDLLDDLARLDERFDQTIDRARHSEQLSADVEALETLIRTLRRDVLATARTAAVSLTPDVVEQAHGTLAAITGTQRWLGVSLDPLQLAEHRLISARDDVRREVDGLSRIGQPQKSREAAIARLSSVHADLDRARTLIDASSQRSMVGQFEYAAQRETVVASFAELHELRLLRPSSVGGLPVVTLDAYVRGAQALDAECPVDWSLLAGIGRVESRHGTIDDTTVQRSGRVTKDIFGPLLDGGATEREAVQAAADAIEAAAAAEEELRLAELEAEEPEPEFDESLWGDALQRVKETEARVAIDDGVGRAAPPPPVVEEAPPARFDPLLWGDDLPFDEDDLEDIDTDDLVDEDAEEPEFRGNGFAVIRDSDNGRLDGNNRWDRAVGPMQFIPETWAYWETDGNDDGVIDPQNLYDAAATAGQFLCHLSGTRGASPYSFVLGYNSSQTYVRNVMAVADAFGANELPTASDAANA